MGGLALEEAGPEWGRGRGRHLGEVAPPGPLALPCAAAREREAAALGSLERPPAFARRAEVRTGLSGLPARPGRARTDPRPRARPGTARGAGPQPPRPLAPGGAREVSEGRAPTWDPGYPWGAPPLPSPLPDPVPVSETEKLSRYRRKSRRAPRPTGASVPRPSVCPSLRAAVGVEALSSVCSRPRHPLVCPTRPSERSPVPRESPGPSVGPSVPTPSTFPRPRLSRLDGSVRSPPRAPPPPHLPQPPGSCAPGAAPRAHARRPLPVPPPLLFYCGGEATGRPPGLAARV